MAATLSMAREDVIVSAFHALTSDEFKPSNFSDNNTLQALVSEYLWVEMTTQVTMV